MISDLKLCVYIYIYTFKSLIIAFLTPHQNPHTHYNTRTRRKVLPCTSPQGIISLKTTCVFVQTPCLLVLSLNRRQD